MSKRRRCPPYLVICYLQPTSRRRPRLGPVRSRSRSRLQRRSPVADQSQSCPAPQLPLYIRARLLSQDRQKLSDNHVQLNSRLCETIYENWCILYLINYFCQPVNLLTKIVVCHPQYAESHDLRSVLSLEQYTSICTTSIRIVVPFSSSARWRTFGRVWLAPDECAVCSPHGRLRCIQQGIAMHSPDSDVLFSRCVITLTRWHNNTNTRNVPGHRTPAAVVNSQPCWKASSFIHTFIHSFFHTSLRTRSRRRNEWSVGQCRYMQTVHS